MKKKIISYPITSLMASLLLASCSTGKENQRDKNLEQAMLAHFDSIPNIEYAGMSDVRVFDDNSLQTVIIYYVSDSIGNKIERNARVTTNNDCSEVYIWKDLDSKVLGDAKRMVSDKLEEKGIRMDGSLIDALIELKRR